MSPGIDWCQSVRRWSGAGEGRNKSPRVWCQSQVQPLKHREGGCWGLRAGVFFFSFSLWEKRGLGTCWHPTALWKGAGGGGGGGGGGGVRSLSFLPPSSNSTLPRCPQLRPFRELGGGRGVCVCVCVKCWGGGSYWSRAEWNLWHCLPSCTPPPRCLTPCLPPPFSRDKECPECLASPAVSNN